MSAHSTATRTRSWPETAALARAWRQPVAGDEPERLAPWHVPLGIAIWSVILYGFLDAGWAVAISSATAMVLAGMQKRAD